MVMSSCVQKIKGRKILLPDGSWLQGVLSICSEGRLVEIQPLGDQQYYGCWAEDWGELSILPGAVDTHVHLNEPGRTQWEGFFSGTQAALAGGVTTLIDMPLNNIPSTLSAKDVAQKAKSFDAQGFCDVGLWGGVTPQNLGALQELWEAGVWGFKCFLSDPGTEEFTELDREQLIQAAETIQKLGATLLVHAEFPSSLHSFEGNPRAYQSYLKTRPERAEVDACQMVIDVARETGCSFHIVHVASPEALGLLLVAREEGLAISWESCSHYLYFCAEEVKEGETLYKCAPPIREERLRNRLLAGVLSGSIQHLASDHSPCPVELKLLEEGDFCQAWGGIAGLQYWVSAAWTALSEQGMSLSDFWPFVSSGPLKLIPRLGQEKGTIEVGKRADLVVFDPELVSEVRVEENLHRHRSTPYLGRKLKGSVVATYLGGRCVYRESKVDTTPYGRFLIKKSED